MATKKKRKTRHGPRRPQSAVEQRSKLTRHLSKAQARRRNIRLVVISALVAIVAIGLVAGSMNSGKSHKSVTAGAGTTLGTAATTDSGLTSGSTTTVVGPSTTSAQVPQTGTTLAYRVPGDPGSALPPDPRHPDLSVTPGATDPKVTSATIRSTICRTGYETAYPAVPAALQARVFAEYSIPTPAKSYVIDLLVPAELGGSDDLSNLWPEPTTGTDSALDKDRIEVRLRNDVCAGKTALATAQHQIINWDNLPPA